MHAPTTIAIVVLVKNEASDISECLASIPHFFRVYVVDSGSTDGTQDISLRLGAQVFDHPFESFSAQRNWAIDTLPSDHTWQFHLDADERLTPELVSELCNYDLATCEESAFRVSSCLMFQGQWLRRAGQFPAYQVRLINRFRCRFEEHGHGQREYTAGPIGTLKHPLLHYAFSKGIHHWFVKHVAYAQKEAREKGSRQSVWKLFSKDRTSARRTAKYLARRLPFRYLLRLFHILIVHRALLDGRHGVTYALMLASYESMIEVFTRIDAGSETSSVG